MAVKLGVDRLGLWADRMGFGKKSGVRLPDEAAGIVASTKWAQSQGRPGVFTGELAQAGIGQNVIAVTPLQLLNAYCTLANGGRLFPAGNRARRDGWRRQARQAIRAGGGGEGWRERREPANDADRRARGDHLRPRLHSRPHLPGALSGKTGTAEFGTPTSEGVLPFHSWFVAYLPTKPGATDADLAVITFSYSAMCRATCRSRL